MQDAIDEVVAGGGGGGYDEYENGLVKKILDAADSFTIPTDFQYIVSEEMIIDGALTVDGEPGRPRHSGSVQRSDDERDSYGRDCGSGSGRELGHRQGVRLGEPGHGSGACGIPSVGARLQHWSRGQCSERLVFRTISRTRGERLGP